jgi:hypothetical protein
VINKYGASPLRQKVEELNAGICFEYGDSCPYLTPLCMPYGWSDVLCQENKCVQVQQENGSDDAGAGEGESDNDDGMTGDDESGTGSDDGMTGDDESGTGSDDGMTGDGESGTGSDDGMTGDDESGTGSDDGMTGDGESGTGSDDGMTGDGESGTGSDDGMPGDDEDESESDDGMPGDDESGAGSDDGMTGDDESESGSDDDMTGDDESGTGSDDGIPGDDEDEPGSDDGMPGDDESGAGSDDAFWSEAAPSLDTRLVYVSSSQGDDSQSGTSIDDPVRTLAEAKSLMRDGFPDRMLLKRGDVWHESFEAWTLSGRSANEPMVIGAYGEAAERPHIELTEQRAMYLLGSPKHLWITSLRVSATTPSERQGFLFHYSGSDGEDLLFEDLYIEGFNGNIMVDQTDSATAPYNNMRFRRVISVDAVLAHDDGVPTTSTGTQGLFLSYTDGALIEESIFDHNGRAQDPNLEISGLFAHNIYIAADNQNFEMRGSIVANAGSHGIKCMSGGVLRDNVFLRNPINMMLGHAHANPGGSVSLAENNIILDSQAINSEMPRGWGINLMNLKDSFVRNNIIAGLNSQSSGGKGIIINIDDENAFDDVRLVDNAVVDWPGVAFTVWLDDNAPYDLRFKRNHLDTRGDSFMFHLSEHELADEVTFADNIYYADPIPVFASVDNAYWDTSQWQNSANDVGSTVVPYVEGKWDALSIEAYQESIAQTSTLDAFMSMARAQRQGAWDQRYTAEAVQEYCFAQFDTQGGN